MARACGRLAHVRPVSHARIATSAATDGPRLPATLLDVTWRPGFELDFYGLQTIIRSRATVVDGDFEWDDDKAASNLDKHGDSFPEAATVFADPYAVYLDDGSGTGRMVVIGTSLRERVLYVVHIERGDRDRIISARAATGPERDVYETGGHNL